MMLQVLVNVYENASIKIHRKELEKMNGEGGEEDVWASADASQAEVDERAEEGTVGSSEVWTNGNGARRGTWLRVPIYRTRLKVTLKVKGDFEARQQVIKAQVYSFDH
jgi:hypothetical protein